MELRVLRYFVEAAREERLKHSNLSTIPKKGRTKPSPLRAGEK